MCTYATVNTEVNGSVKGAGGKWQRVREATVYFDHPVHAMAGHTLNIDLRDASGDPSQRFALELTGDAAKKLMAAMQEVLRSAPEELLTN